MPTSFEELVFSIIATDKGASAAFDRFRQKVDQTSKSVDENSKSVDKNAKSIDNLGSSAASATPLLGGMAGSGGMGALIGAGVALSPVIATVGTGLAGFGLAAYGAVAPVLKASQAAGGLRANMAKLDPEQQQLARSVLGLGKQYDAFSKSLQPQVLGVFGKGVRIAGHLMHDLQPIAKNTGTALGQVLDRVDAEFQSGTWKSFFSWMSAQVGPDIQLIGKSVVDLVDALPALLRSLQPVAIQLLQFVDDAAKLLDWAGRVNQRVQVLGHTANTSGGFIGFFAHAVKQAFDQMVPGAGHVQKLLPLLAKLGGTSKTAGGNAKTAGVYVQSMADAVNNLNAAESKSLDTQLAYSNALIASGNDAKALRQALHASSGQVGLHTAAQRASFSAANTYISDLENAAKQAVASGKGATGAARAIASGLPILTQAARHNKLLWQEVQTLKGWLDKLRLEPAIREKINVTGRGSWSVAAATHALAQGPFPGAAGMLVPGTGNRDTVHALLTPGEAVVPKHLVAALAPFLKANQVPGFAAGGLVPSYGGALAGLQPWAARDLHATNRSLINSMGGAIAHAVVAAVRSAASSFGGAAGPGGGAPSANAALARRMYGSVMGPADWAAWNYVAMRESGWSNIARNASSGAYGIAQALPPTKYPFAGQAAGGSNPAAQISWMWNYMAQRYGGPQGAAAHERAFNWYDSPAGTWMPPGPSLAFNGTGNWEHLTPDSGRKTEIHNHFAEGSIVGPVDADLLARRLAFQLDN